MDKSDSTKRPKRKRVSKKSKKSWRKHSDIKDVETYLEDKRLQERTGGLVAEKSNAELFVLERKAEPSPQPVPRDRRQPRSLQCHAALELDTRIAPIRASRMPVAQKDTISKRTDLANRRRAGKKPEIVEKLTVEPPAQKRNRLPVATYDLWASDAVLAPHAGEDEHYLTVCKKKRIAPPSHYLQKPSDLPAIEAPHPGMSYRPAEQDHKDLLQKAAEVEMKRLREQQRLKRALDDKFPTIKDAPDENTWLKEWASHDNEDTGNADEDAEGEKTDLVAEVSHNPPVRREDKKTERERKRLKAEKEKEKAALRAKNEKIRSSGVLRLKSAKREVMRREMALAARLTRRERQKEMTGRTMTRRLGRLRYEEPTIDIKLSSEQVNSLRLLKPEGSLLRDHMSSLQKRNIVEPRQRAKVVRKYKPKVFEKKSHREIAE